MTVKRLAKDGSYSTPYRRDEDGGHRSIHAYSDQAEERKKQFLKDARALLKAIGSELIAYGFTKHDISVNEAGIGSSGEAYGTYIQPGLDRSIFLTVDTTCILIPLAQAPEEGQPLNTLGAMTTRSDGVVLMGRWKEPALKKGYSDMTGPNTFFDANASSSELAVAALQLVGITPLKIPQRELQQGSFFDIAA